MPEMARWLNELYARNVHFSNHGSLYCPTKKGSTQAMYYFLHYSLSDNGEGALFDFCPMCGTEFKKGFTEAISHNISLIE